jgi:argininosuccinate lyase
VAAEQDGGLSAVSKLLRAKSVELSNAVEDLITATEAELIEDLPDRGR